MGANPVLPAMDTFVLVMPLLGILAMAMFGLDKRLGTPKSRPEAQRFFCEVEGKGRSFLSDPDGKPWQKGVVRQIEALWTGVEGGGWKEALHGDGKRHHRAMRIRIYIIEN